MPIQSQRSLWDQYKIPDIIQYSIESLCTKCTKSVSAMNNKASALPTKMVNKPQDRKSHITTNDYYVKSVGPKEYDLYPQKIQK